MAGILLADIRQALRLCRRQPYFSLFAVASLSLAIGSATAVFTLVDFVLLRALPFHAPDRLVWMYNARTERDRAPFSIPDLTDYASAVGTLEGVAPFTNWTANLTGNGEPERLEGTRVSGNFFSLLGAAALHGRTLDPGDATSNAKVAVLTYGLWMRRFGGDPEIVGRNIVLNGVAHTVVGVLPSTFLFPFRYAEVAVPLALADDPRRADRGANFLRVVARLKAGVALTQAKADLDTIARRLQQQFPDDDARKTGVNLYPLHAEIVGDYRQILWTLLGAIGVLLFVGFGNLANLLLARAAGRRTELGMRQSLGASRFRIVRQLTTEAALLATFGSLGGIAVALFEIVAWRSFGPANFPRMLDVALDMRVLAFAGVLSALTVLVCGVLPAWSASRDLIPALGGGTRALTASRRQQSIRHAFVVLQVSGSVVLLVCMGVVARGFSRLERVAPGFTADHALSIQLSLPPARYGGRDSIAAFCEALSARLTSIAEIRAAGAVSLLPLSGLLATFDIAFPDRAAPPPDEVPQAHFRVTTPGYFAAAGIRVVAGREFAENDTSRGRPVAIVSRTLAQRHWPGQEAVGQFIQIVQTPPLPPFEVVGLVDDVKQFDLERPPTADLYVPIDQMPRTFAPNVSARMYWVVRTKADPAPLGALVREAVHAVDAQVATSSVRTLDDVVAAALAAKHTSVRLLELFGLLAVGLCTVGVYGIAAFSANERRRELAIRSAFGAGRFGLVVLMIRNELRTIVAGVALGLSIALVCAQALVGAPFATSPRDPATYIAVAALICTVGALASYIPAARASLTNPAELLRQ